MHLAKAFVFLIDLCLGINAKGKSMKEKHCARSCFLRQSSNYASWFIRKQCEVMRMELNMSECSSVPNTVFQCPNPSSNPNLHLSRTGWQSQVEADRLFAKAG